MGVNRPYEVASAVRGVGEDLRRAALFTGRRVLGRFENWHVIGAPGEPAYVNGWGNFGNNLPSLAFLKDTDGVVRFRGAATANPSTGVTLFTLLPGYRPARVEMLHAGAWIAGGPSGPQLVVVHVEPSGAVGCLAAAGQPVGYLLFDNSRFWVP